MKLRCIFKGHFWSIWCPWACWKLDRVPPPEYVADQKQFRYCMNCNKPDMK